MTSSHADSFLCCHSYRDDVKSDLSIFISVQIFGIPSASTQHAKLLQELASLLSSLEFVILWIQNVGCIVYSNLAVNTLSHLHPSTASFFDTTHCTSFAETSTVSVFQSTDPCLLLAFLERISPIEKPRVICCVY